MTRRGCNTPALLDHLRVCDNVSEAKASLTIASRVVTNAGRIAGLTVGIADCIEAPNALDQLTYDVDENRIDCFSEDNFVRS
jgi:hypothetical protein